MQTKSVVTVVAVGVAAFALTTTGSVAGSLVTSAQIKNHTIQTKDLASSTVSALKKAAAPKFYQVKGDHELDNANVAGFRALCKKGDVAVSGGMAPGGPDIAQEGSFPYSDSSGNGWAVFVQNQSAESRSLVVYAICVAH